MIIADYVLYNDEPFIEFRLKDLDKYADQVVIVESIYTHSWNRKKIYFII